jgi:putative pantetheine hydrolase
MYRATAGARNAITDVPGIRVGHATRVDGGALTGTTVLLLPPATTATVDVRGGAPATRETTALDPRYGGREIPAIVLTGGSSYGLSTADGVQKWLGGPNPLVPAAALFDLGRGGDFGRRPDAALAVEAAEAASTTVAQGNVGAGTGAVNAGLKGGIGTASVVLPGGVVVAAIAALNAVGPSVDLTTGLPHGHATGVSHRLRDGEVVAWQEFPDFAGDDLAAARERLPGIAGNPLNTVIGVVATNARLDAGHLFRLDDGDTVFAATTGTADARAEDVIAAATEVFARALVHGLLAAEPVGHFTAYRELYPKTALGYRGAD